MMQGRRALGMLTPSSNTVLEPLTTAMLADLPEVSAHFSRFRVTHISLEGQALAQFKPGNIVEAAKLLADAKVDAIAWNGTAAGWIGLEADEALCNDITATTGIAACTATLALRSIMRRCGHRTLGLVAPYIHPVQQNVIANFARHGMEVVAERHAGISLNWDFSTVSEADLSRMVRNVAQARPDAITIYCTNLRAAHLVEDWEREFGIPVYDTVATTLWQSLKIAGIDTRRVKGWGQLFNVD